MTCYYARTTASPCVRFLASSDGEARGWPARVARFTGEYVEEITRKSVIDGRDIVVYCAPHVDEVFNLMPARA